MPKRPITPGYIIFYILFWPDTWRILIGVLAAVLLVPRIINGDMTVFAMAMLHVMVAGIGYAASGRIAGAIVRFLKKLILGKGQP